MGYEQYSRGFGKAIEEFSQIIKIQQYDISIGSVYDDDVSLTKSMNAGSILTGSSFISGSYVNTYSGLPLWCSGVVQSLDTTDGSTDSNLLEQGKIIYSDSKIYLNGSIQLTGSENMVKIQIGSPTGEFYSLIPLGAIDKIIDGVPIFKTAYIRRLTTGSLFGEI